jgi:hypothetical protein
MNKLFLLLGGLFISLLLTSCLDADTPHVDGLWQLQTIHTSDNKVLPVDTLYYSFMLKRNEFTYIILHDRSTEPEQAETRYGYVDFPAKDKMHILLDKQYHWEIALFPWNNIEVTYNILQLTSKKMILEDNSTQYHFIKF